MPAVDDRGRLFGLVNIVDLVVILIVAALVLGGAYKILGRRSTAPVKTVRFEAIIPAIPPQSATEVKVGDKLVSGNNFVPDTVTSVEVRPAMLGVTRADGTRARVPDPYLKDLIVWVQGKAPLAGGTVSVAGQEIRAGADFILKTQTFEGNGTILEVRISNQ